MDTQSKSQSSEKQDYSAPQLNVLNISETAAGGVVSSDGAITTEGLPS